MGVDEIAEREQIQRALDRVDIYRDEGIQSILAVPLPAKDVRA
jgi:hypothetical protein